jgi:GTPase SAR1 family protein
MPATSSTCTTKANIGVEFQTQHMDIDGKEVKAQIWVTGGQEHMCVVTSVYYRGDIGALIVYNISHRSTFSTTSLLAQRAQHYYFECLLTIFGCWVLFDLSGCCAFFRSALFT